MLLTQKLRLFCFFLFINIALLGGCDKPSADHWVDLIPETALFVVVPEQNSSLEDMLGARYMPWFDDISPAAFQLVSTVQEYADQPVIVEALMLYPDTSNDWQPVWITRKTDGLKELLTSEYQRDFEQNRYRFKQHTIEKLFFSDRVLYIIDIDGYTVFSESSLAIENMLRAASRFSSPADIRAEQIEPGTIIFNTPGLDTWFKQIAQVTYRPYLSGVMKGTKPVVMRFNSSGNGNRNWSMSGTIPLDQEKSNLVRMVSSQPREITLDRFIPATAAAFSIFRADPLRTDLDGLEPAGDLDAYLSTNERIIRDLRQHLGSETAFVSFADSGPASTSEYMFLRSIQNASGIRSLLDHLASENLVVKSDNTYSVTSSKLGRLLGSELHPATNYYVTVYNQVLAIAQRNGLAESVGADAERRRVIYYEDEYASVRESLSNPVSSVVYANTEQFGGFIQPWLYPQNYMSTFISVMDHVAITTRANSSGDALELTISNFEVERTERPFRDRWLYPLADTGITGTPVLADVTGNSRNEVIFSTENGSVFILAPDGTVVEQMLTDADTPIGQPVVYDWYGNNQNVIMQAAGNKVYAWNQNGVILPNFPVVMNEEITTPLIITDITGNGVAEMIVATADRSVHILNARGNAINGWPQSTNSVVRTKPLITRIGGQLSLFAFAENALHAWNVNGVRRDGYPVFLSAQVNGSPAQKDDHILASGMDGNLYAIGPSPLFAAELSATHQTGSVYVQSISVSNSSLNSTPVIRDLLQRSDSGLIREDLILLQSENGSLFLYNSDGELRFSQSMGQPSSPDFSPIITDINSDNRLDIVALSGFGRLYAWDAISSERHQDLPTSSMQHPLIYDYFGNGNKEVIALTRDGLQAWTIFFTRRAST